MRSRSPPRHATTCCISGGLPKARASCKRSRSRAGQAHGSSSPRRRTITTGRPWRHTWTELRSRMRARSGMPKKSRYSVAPGRSSIPCRRASRSDSSSPRPWPVERRLPRSIAVPCARSSRTASRAESSRHSTRWWMAWRRSSPSTAPRSAPARSRASAWRR